MPSEVSPAFGKCDDEGFVEILVQCRLSLDVEKSQDLHYFLTVPKGWLAASSQNWRRVTKRVKVLETVNCCQ